MGEDAPDPGLRGGLVIHPRVIRRVAERAASEVPSVVTASGGLRGRLRRGSPTAEAVVAGRRTILRVDVEVAWPAKLAHVTAAVRDRVSAQVQALAGVEVDRVDVAVPRLVLERAADRRRVE